MGYKLSRKADEDMVNVYIEGIGNFGVQQAEKYYAELEEKFQLLASNPTLARERLEITPPVRIHPHKSHIIVYVIDENEDIFILRVRHGHEDWKNNPIE